MDKYKGSPALVSALKGGMYLLRYPQQHNRPAIYPYCIIVPVSTVPEYTFSEEAENSLALFSIYDDSDGVATVEDAGEALKAVFDFAALSVSGWNHVCMMREYTGLFKEGDFWHCVITYRLEIQKVRS